MSAKAGNTHSVGFYRFGHQALGLKGLEHHKPPNGGVWVFLFMGMRRRPYSPRRQTARFARPEKSSAHADDQSAGP